MKRGIAISLLFMFLVGLESSSSSLEKRTIYFPRGHRIVKIAQTDLDKNNTLDMVVGLEGKNARVGINRSLASKDLHSTC